MKKSVRNILIGIFVGTLLLRLVLAFSIPNLTYESYFNLRQVEHISQTGLPLYHDELSYGGRDTVFLPFFHYLAALFSIVLPFELFAKVLPNLLLATMPLTVFFISKQISKDDTASLFAAGIVGFLPILFQTNAFTVQSLFLPLLLFNIYAFLNHNREFFLYMYILSFLLLSITSSATVLLIIGFAIYLLLSVLEGKRFKKSEMELIIFSLFFFLWTQFLFFKDVFIKEGVSFIWQNIPSQIVQEYFPRFSITEAVILVSVVPFLAGIYVVYRALFQLKNERAFLLISFVISTAILTWLRFIEFRLSLAFFGAILAVLFASFYKDVKSALAKTKIAHLDQYLSIATIILLLLTTVQPAIASALEQKTPGHEEIKAFQWIAANAPESVAVAAPMEEGHLVTYFSKKKNVIDDHFNLIKDIDRRYADVNSLYKSSFETHALGLLDEYGVRYIVLTLPSQASFDIETLPYFEKECFSEVYSKKTKIYAVRCNLRTNE